MQVTARGRTEGEAEKGPPVARRGLLPQDTAPIPILVIEDMADPAVPPVIEDTTDVRSMTNQGARPGKRDTGVVIDQPARDLMVGGKENTKARLMRRGARDQ